MIRKLLKLLVVIILIGIIGLAFYVFKQKPKLTEIAHPSADIFGEGNTTNPGKDDNVEYFKCEKDSDCITVKNGPCSCAMGGQATSINRVYKVEWDSKQSESFSLCLAMLSNHWTCGSSSPKCISGICHLVITK